MKAMTEAQSQFKLKLESIAKASDKPWHSQDVLQFAACIVLLDLAGVKDQAKRDSIMSEWTKKCAELPGLGANASQLAQKLGREKQADKLAASLQGF